MNVTMNVTNNDWPLGNKVAAIKHIRAIMGLGLKDAKDLVEDAAENTDGTVLDLSTQQIAAFREQGFDLAAGNLDAVRNMLKGAAIIEIEANNFVAAEKILSILAENYGI